MKRSSPSAPSSRKLSVGPSKPSPDPGSSIRGSQELERCPLPAWSASKDGREVCFNDSCRRLLKLERNVGPIEDLLERYIHPEDRLDWSKVWREFIDGACQSLEHLVRWQFPKESGETPMETWLAIRAQRVARNATPILGWFRKAEAEQALNRLENLIRG